MIMKKKQLLLLLLIGLLYAEGQGFAQTQITPECSVTMEADRYIIHFTLPDYTFENEDGNDYEDGNGDGGVADSCGIFSEIVFNSMSENDVLDLPGYPALPFYSLDLLIPNCTEIINVEMSSAVTDYDYPPYFIVPAHMGNTVNIDETYTELDGECYNTQYYSNGYSCDYPSGFYTNFYSISNTYNISGYKGVTFSIFPFSYHPEQGYMEVLREVDFILELDCGDLTGTIDEIREEPTLDAFYTQLYFDTFEGMTIANNIETNGNYLIIASHREMEESLMPYVYYKLSQNYNTEVIYLDEEDGLGNSYWIRNLIYGNGFFPFPDFVLLVGSLNDIPPYSGTGTTANPFSDDGYHPRVGRWIVKKQNDIYGYYPDLDNIINKTIYTEHGYLNTYSTAALFSGKDKWKRRSKFFFNDLKIIANNSFNEMGIPVTLHNGRTIADSTAQTYMKNAIQNHPRFFIYSGHGFSPDPSGIASPYKIRAYANGTNQISSLENYSPHPMGFGFACSLNTFTTDNNFGAKWVATSNAGGVTFYGSTTTTYNYPDRYLAKKIFNQLYKMTSKLDNFPISLWLRVSEDKYYHSLQVVWRGRQIAKYNLIGDPTLAVYGMDYSGIYAPFHAPKIGNITCEGTQNDQSVIQIVIYDINGHRIKNIDPSASIESLPLPCGVYLIKTIFSDYTFETNKIIK